MINNFTVAIRTIENGVIIILTIYKPGAEPEQLEYYFATRDEALTNAFNYVRAN